MGVTDRGQSWEPIEAFEPVGGNLALDLTNTASDRSGGELREKLFVYGDLMVWAERTSVLAPDRIAALRAEAESRPADAALVLAHVLELREALYRLFSAIAAGREPAAGDLDVLNAYLAEAATAAPRRVVRGEAGWEWGWQEGAEPLATPLWPAVWAAGELLTAGDLTRVKECAGEGCNWLFVDLSRNRSRRWCAMKDCGNRAKARRHYARQRGEDG